MAQTSKPRAASTDQKTSWSWKRLFGKDDQTNAQPAVLADDLQKPGIARRLSRKAVPGLPRAGTFKRQQSELRDRLEPVIPKPDERRTVSVDRRRNISDRSSISAIANPLPRLSAPELLETQEKRETVDDLLKEEKITIETAPEEEAQDYVDVEKNVENGPLAIDTQSISTAAFDEIILEELEKRWILNLSMHFRDRSKREKFFVTFAETPTHWRRVTVSLDYRNAPPGSLEDELLRTRFQRDKSARIYEAIRESLADIQFYETVTNLKLQTENERLHVHVVEDVSEIIQYPPVRAINHLNCRRVREDELVFDSHLSGFVYKVRVGGQVFIKKEIPGADTVDGFLYEINALHQLADSRSVIQFGGVVLDNRGECVKGLLISFAEQGALIDVIYDGEGNISWRRRERWARQIVQGLAEIHEAGFVQGDFTLSNIVIDNHDEAKIIDINRRGCPVGWEPPEVRDLIDSNQGISMYIGVKSDLFQLGMVLFALATQHDEPETLRPFDMGSFPSEIPVYFREICHRCLDEDPRRRLQASTLLKSFPEMEDSFHDEPLRAVPIVVDAQHVDEKEFPGYQGKSGVHSPPYTPSGLDRTINVHDYAVTDVSDDFDYYPRRGRSPPAPNRTETAGTSMPFSTASSQYPQALGRVPRTSVLSPESIPLPDPSNASDYLNSTRDTTGSTGVDIMSAMDSNGIESSVQSADATRLSTGFDFLDFATKRPSDSKASTSHTAPELMQRDTTRKDSKLSVSRPEYMDEKSFLNRSDTIEVNLIGSHGPHQGLQHSDQDDMDQWTTPETGESRSTVAIPEISEIYPAELTGVGAHNSGSHFQIPPNLDDDFTTETH
ncbi:hypothetical protein HYALB_00001459 [Hymenoscyphus albidus]|uniref:Protein kinase domain-containing protein n=1 Tax=Hymenoscyphus albidus TaxID=595503 RepID=A0A9N9LEQ1_9HELO|nr:hypothetical protein HYALB_00001459 [Hymenoscyphus albidus]